MKVVKLEAFPVRIPYKRVEASSLIARSGVADVLVKVTTEDAAPAPEADHSMHSAAPATAPEGHAAFRLSAHPQSGSYPVQDREQYVCSLLPGGRL